MSPSPQSVNATACVLLVKRVPKQEEGRTRRFFEVQFRTTKKDTVGVGRGWLAGREIKNMCKGIRSFWTKDGAMQTLS